jgi:hypothetical protein
MKKVDHLLSYRIILIEAKLTTLVFKGPCHINENQFFDWFDFFFKIKPRKICTMNFPKSQNKKFIINV